MKKILAMALCLVMMMAMAVPAFAETTVAGEMGWTCGSTEENHVCEEVAEGEKPSCYVETGLTHSGFGGGYVNKLDTDYTIDVVGKLDANNNGIPDEDETDPTPIPETPTIAVDIYWTDMEFNYQQSWDEINLTYIWTWQNGEDYIQVDNRSSVGINASVTFTGEGEYGNDAVEFEFDNENEVGATWKNNTLTLGYGNQTPNDKDENGETIVTAPSGTLYVNVADTTRIATDETAVKSVILGQITINVSAVREPQTVVLGTFTEEMLNQEFDLRRTELTVYAGDTLEIYYESADENTYPVYCDMEYVHDKMTTYDPDENYMAIVYGENMIGQTVELYVQMGVDSNAWVFVLTIQ